LLFPINRKGPYLETNKIHIMIKYYLLSFVFFLFLCSCSTEQPSVLRQGAFYTEEQGKAELRELETMYTNKDQWEVRKKLLRKSILKGLNLTPLPQRTPLNAMVTSKRIKDGYSVENVYFESIPGFFVCGNLYRPLDNSIKHPAILCPHGHFNGDSLLAWGRFRPDMQKRCATFARMGAVVFSYSMFAYGGECIWQLDSTASIENPDIKLVNKNHGIPLALTMQTWNSIRSIDFLETLPDVDISKLAVTGASGGGTQTFLLAALDDRITVSVPVVMVSCHFFGGCGCESGLPIHQSEKHFTNNAEIASMIAPKPLLMISDGADWTKNEPTVEYPFIKRTFSFYNSEENVKNVHFPEGVHDYGYNKRIPVYSFMAIHLGLNIGAVADSDEMVDETKSEVEKAEVLLAFSKENPFPTDALIGSQAIEQALKKLQ
jgi:uncharacterized protein